MWAEHGQLEVSSLLLHQLLQETQGGAGHQMAGTPAATGKIYLSCQFVAWFLQHRLDLVYKKRQPNIVIDNKNSKTKNNTYMHL